jgi:hypothetical protein
MSANAALRVLGWRGFDNDCAYRFNVDWRFNNGAG